jgi:hypothetical protein
METVLFTGHSLVVFAITTSAIALLFSVLGLATTHHMRAEIEDQFSGPAN